MHLPLTRAPKRPQSHTLGLIVISLALLALLGGWLFRVGREGDLRKAVSERDPARVAALLRAGVSANGSDEHGMRPLDWAAGGGDSRIVDLLLLHGVQPNRRSGNGLSPLGIACRRGHPGAAMVLIRRGADPNLRLAGDRTALMVAASARQIPQGTAVEVVRALLGSGADPALRDAEGLTARDHAAAVGNDAVAAVLLVGVPGARAPTPQSRSDLKE
jgi:hypothetical protein